MVSSGPFKRCASCANKIPFIDGHDHCLFCLGERHQPGSCQHCKKLTKPALKQRLQQLHSHLWGTSLRLSGPFTMEPTLSPAPLIPRPDPTASLAPTSTLSQASLKISKPKKSSAMSLMSVPKATTKDPKNCLLYTSPSPRD